MDILFVVLAVAGIGSAAYFYLQKQKAETDARRIAEQAAENAAAPIRKELAAARDELSKKKGEASELREKLNEVRARAHKQRESDKTRKGDSELADQLAATRRQLDENNAHLDALSREASGMQGEIARLRESNKKLDDAYRAAQAAAAEAAARAAAGPAEAPAEGAAAEPRRAPEPRVVSDAELTARVQSLETQLKELRRKATDAEDEMRKARGKASTANRMHLLVKNELDLFKEKLVWSEKRVVELEKLLFANNIALPERAPAPQPKPPQLAPALQTREGANTGGEGVVAEVADYEPEAAPAEAGAEQQAAAPAAEGVQAVPPVRRRRTENDAAAAPGSEQA